LAGEESFEKAKAVLENTKVVIGRKIVSGKFKLPLIVAKSTVIFHQ